MNELVYLKKDDAFTDSLIIAKHSGVDHRKVKSLIRKYRSRLQGFGKLSSPCEVESTGGRKATYYELNEEQATFLITLMKNTEAVVSFKVNLVSEFYKMRKFIAEKQTAAWLETRQQGKLTRKAETDVLKQLVEYAKKQGSGHADMLYMTYSKLANKYAGVDKRDSATVMQLNNLSLMEHIILNVIQNGITAGMYYKEIYKASKARLESMKDIAFLESAS